VEVAEGLRPFTAGCQLSKLVAAAQVPAAARLDDCIQEFQPQPSTNNPAATEVKPQVPRRTWVGWLCLGGILTAVLLLVVGIRRSLNEQPSDLTTASPQVPSAPPLEPLVPGVWHNLLQTPPDEVFWPPCGTRPQFDPVLRSLTVHNEGQALLGLGTIPPDTAFKYQVTINQPGWPGRIGIFFGYHQFMDQDECCIRYRGVWLLPFLPRNNMPYQIACFRGIIGPAEVKGRARDTIENITSWWVPAPPLHEQQLQIEVSRAGQLTAVFWGGKPIREVLDPQASARFFENTWHGRFGVIVMASSGLFRDARLMLVAKAKRPLD
jgi:hypothetical protein